MFVCLFFGGRGFKSIEIYGVRRLNPEKLCQALPRSRKPSEPGFFISVQSWNLRADVGEQSLASIKRNDCTATRFVTIRVRLKCSMTSEYDRRAAIIVALRALGSRSEIAEFLKLPSSTVYDVADRFSAEAAEAGSGDTTRKSHDRCRSKRRSQDFIER